MIDRDDPMYYEFDIEDRKSGEVKRARMFCWWSGLDSIRGLLSMCDCQLGAFFCVAGTQVTWQEWKQGSARPNEFCVAQNKYLEQNQCNHKPSRKYRVLRAHRPDGQVIEIEPHKEAA